MEVLNCICLCLLASSLVDSCTKVSSCACVFSMGTIDLSPLSNENGTAFFHNLPDVDHRYVYSWNPCHAFSDGDGCTGVAACQTDAEGNKFSLGTQDTSHFISDQRLGLLITYHAVTDAHRRLFVRLECNQSVNYSVNVQGETAPGSTKYFINLITKYACPVPGGSVPIATGLSTGEILIIVLVVVVLLYVILGLTFQLVVRKASGRQLFPDYCLCLKIPQLVKGLEHIKNIFVGYIGYSLTDLEICVVKLYHNFHVSYEVAHTTDADTAAFINHMETESR